MDTHKEKTAAPGRHNNRVECRMMIADAMNITLIKAMCSFSNSVVKGTCRWFA